MQVVYSFYLTSFSQNKQIIKLKKNKNKEITRTMPSGILSLPWEFLFAYYLKRHYCLEPGLRTRSQACINATEPFILTYFLVLCA